MEASGNASEPYENGGGGGGGGGSTGRGVSMLQQIPTLNLLQSPLSFVLEYSGIVPARSTRRDTEEEAVNAGAVAPDSPPTSPPPPCDTSGGGGGGVDSAEVSIRIIGGGEQDDHSVSSRGRSGEGEGGEEAVGVDGGSLRMAALDDQPRIGEGVAEASGRAPLVSPSSSVSRTGIQDDSSSSQSYDIQQIAKWIEQILPFSILLLLVFIRQHLLGTAFALLLLLLLVFVRKNYFAISSL